MSELCRKCGRAPRTERRRICHECEKAQKREYMRGYMVRCRGPRRLFDWRGIGVSRSVRHAIYEEARARGVAIEAIIQEWGFRKGVTNNLENEKRRASENSVFME